MKILVLSGDGIGPEIREARLAVLARASARYKPGLGWQLVEIGFAALKKTGTPHPISAASLAPGHSPLQSPLESDASSEALSFQTVSDVTRRLHLLLL